MVMMDPISDMLTRIRNAHHAQHEKVEIPANRIKVELARILKDEGYIKNYKLIQGKYQGVIRVFLKYDQDGSPVIHELKRISKPGRRIYAGMGEIPLVRKGLGVAVVSTSRGVMTDREARMAKIGGEILCTVF